MLKAFGFGLAVLLLATPALSQTVTLTGIDGASHVLDAAVLKSAPRETVTITDHGKSAAYTGVTLRALASLGAAPEGEALKGPALAMVVLVTASDGYRVVLSLGEIDPGLGGRRAILADTVDGGPLDAHLGPYRLVVEGDKRPARSARNVTTIVVKAVP